MKLLRYGEPGIEKPGLLDENGVIRDLSEYVDDISAETLLPENIAKLKKLIKRVFRKLQVIFDLVLV